VGFTGSARKVQLVKGEALFNVAKNKNRPFIVVADDTQVRAVGTSFTVRLPAGAACSNSRSGRRGGSHAPRYTERQTGARGRRYADRSAARRAIATHPVPYSKVARNLAWQYGQIAFDNETLEDAALEFARYSDKKIVVEPAVAGLTITGLFASNDPAGFAKAAASVLNLHAEVGVEEVRISR